jgi:hypothetical protein
MKYGFVCTNKTLVRLQKLAAARYGKTMLNPVTQFPEELQDKLRLPSSHYRDPTGAAIFFYYRWDCIRQRTFTSRNISYSNVLLRFVHRKNKQQPELEHAFEDFSNIPDSSDFN